MQLIKWNRELELGIEDIDNQHKQLITMLNQITLGMEYQQPNSLLMPLVDRMQKYARNHFAAEEKIFTLYAYPERAEHEAEHLTFINTVAYIKKQCKLLDESMSAKIREFLLNWLINHIMTKDMEYKRFIEMNHSIHHD